MKRFLVGPRSWLILIFLTGSPPLFAAGPVSDEPGVWVPTKAEIKGGGTVAKSWERQLREIETLIRANPASRSCAAITRG